MVVFRNARLALGAVDNFFDVLRPDNPALFTDSADLVLPSDSAQVFDLVAARISPKQSIIDEDCQ